MSATDPVSSEKKDGKKPPFHFFYSIQSAMILAFSLITVAVLSLAVFTVYLFTIREMKNISVDYMSQLVSQVNANIERYMFYMENVSNVVGKNTNVLRWLADGSKMGASELLVLEDSAIRHLSGIVNVRSDIVNIALCTSDGRILFDLRGKTPNRHVDFKDTLWYKEAMADDEKTYISTSHVQNIVEGQYNWVVSISKSIKGRNGQVLGVLLLDLNYSLINGLCEDIDMGNRGYLFLLDSEGNIIYHPDQQLLYSHIKNESTDEILHRTTRVDVSTPDGEKIYISHYSNITGWTVVGAAYQDEILRVRSEIMRFYAIAVLAFVPVAVLLSAAISAAVSRSLKKLNRTMQGVQSGRLDTRIQIGAPLEVAGLGDTFNTMMDRIHLLIQQQKEDQEQKRESEIKALQAQINPHFLYNTLDSIIWMAEGGHNQEVVDMTAALAHMLRSSISEERELVPLSSEVANVTSYLTIMKMRYKEKLTFHIDIDLQAENFDIPKLVLQPLVENAISHGIRPKGIGGKITISAGFDKDNLVIRVQDNGIGIEEQVLDRILTSEPTKESGGIGVKNVHERIRLIYGDKYGLSYESRPDKGTVVKLLLPGDFLRKA